MVSDVQTIVTALNNDLTAIRNCTFQGKMIFTLDLTKQAQGLIFSGKIKILLNPTCLPVFF